MPVQTPDMGTGLGPVKPDPQNLSAYSQLVGMRLDKIPWWSQDPATAGYLSGSHLADANFAALAQHLPTVQQWVDSYTSMGGVPGVLSAAYAKALMIPDQETRLGAIRTLDAIRNLPSDQQSAFLAFAEGKTQAAPVQGPMTQSRTGASAASIAAATTTGTATPLAQAFNQIGESNGGTTQTLSGVTLGQGFNENDYNAMYQLFPGLKGKVTFSPGGITASDIVDSYYQNSFPQLSEVRQQVEAGKSLNPFAKNGVTAGAYAGGAFNLFMQAGLAPLIGPQALAIQGASEAAAITGPGAGSLVQGTGVLATALHALGSPMRLVNTALGDASGAIGKIVAPGASANTQQNIGGIALMVGMAGIAKGGAAIKSEVNIPSAAALGGEGYSATEVPGVRDAVTQQLQSNSVTQTLLHPIQSFMFPAIDSLARSFVRNGTDLANNLNNKAFNTLFDYVDQVKQSGNSFEQNFGQLQQRFGTWGNSPDLLKLLLNTPRDQMPLAAADFIQNGGTLSATEIASLKGQVGSASAKISAIDTQLAASDITPETQSALSAQREFLASQQTTMQLKLSDAVQPTVPQLKLPGRGQLPEFLHRAMYQADTPMERAVGAVINFSPQQLVDRWDSALNADYTPQGTLAKLVDKIGNKDRFYNPYTAPVFNGDGSAVPQNVQQTYILDKNTTMLNRLFQQLGVSPADAQVALGSLTNADSAQAWFDVMNHDIFGDKGVIAKYLPDSLPQDVKDRILGTSVNDPLNFRGGIVRRTEGQQPVLEPVLADKSGATPQPLPFLDNEFSNGVGYPDFQDVRDAQGMIRRAVENNRLMSPIYSVGKMVMDASRLVLKPFALVASLPSVILHKMADEMLGNTLNPNVSSVGFVSKVDAGGNVMDFKPTPLAESMRELTTRSLAGALEPGVDTTTVPVSARAILSNPGAYSGAWSSLADNLDHLRGSAIARTIAANGGDIAAVEQAMSGGDPLLSRFYQDNVVPQFKKVLGADATDAQMADLLHTTLERTAERISAATFGNHPDFLNYVATGKLDTGFGSVHPEYSGEANQNYDLVTARVQAARDALQSLPTRNPSEEDLALKQGLQGELQSQLNTLHDLEQQYGIKPQDAGRRILSPEDTKAIRANIKDRVIGGELQLPDIVQVTKEAYDPYFNQSAKDNLMDGLGKISQVGYRGLSVIGKAEGAFARGSFFAQRLDSLTRDYIRRGFSEVDAKAYAALQATNESTDMFYDLSARSTLERQTRNLFWFAPVAGELLYRWAYAIPAQSGAWLPGLALAAARVTNYVDLLKGLGIAHEIYNPKTQKNELDVTIPGSGKLFSWMSNGTVNQNASFPLTGLFSHITAPIPSLSPVPAAALGRLAKHFPALAGISSVLAPFTDFNFFPSTLHNFLGMWGINLPDFSPNYVENSWNKTHDTALQYAYAKMVADGKSQPDPASFGLVSGANGYSGTSAQEKAYGKAYTSWMTQLMSLTNDAARGLYFMKTIDSFAIPGSLNYSTADERAYSQFFANSIAPKLAPGTPMSDALKQSLNNWLAQHPGSLVYSISQGYYTGQKIPPSLIDNNSNYRQLYLDGLKKTMPVDEYARVVAGLTSQDAYLGKMSAAVAQVMGKGGPAQQLVNLLTNWSVKSQASLNYQQNWNNYLNLHPDIKNIINTHTTNMQHAYGIPQKTVEATYVTQTLQGFQQLVGPLTGNSPLSDASYQTILGQLKSLNARLYQQTGGTPTPVEVGLNYYFSHVITPYWNQAQSIYAQIGKVATAHGDTTPLYNELQTLNQKYSNVTYQGKTLPSPQQFSFYSKPAPQQQVILNHWASQPIAWLSDWQRQKLGYPSFSGEDQFWQGIQGIQNTLAQAMGPTPSNPAGISALSSQGKAMSDFAAKQEEALAAKFGSVATQVWNLSNQAPAYRIQLTNHAIASDPGWQQVMQLVNYATQTLTAAGDSPRGYSATAVQLKSAIYGFIQQTEAKDPQFRNIMEQMMLATTTSGAHPTGVPLYESIFFGQFNPAYIPRNLMDAFVPQNGGY